MTLVYDGFLCSVNSFPLTVYIKGVEIDSVHSGGGYFLGHGT